jgi:LacI family transcriptional regulator
MMTEAENSQRPTLRTIAYLAGLGVSTVSRALKDGAEISVETRARVKLIAQQIGYRPNRAGVRLKTGKTNVITLVLNPQDGGSGFFANIVYGISDALAETGYHLVVTPYSLSDPMAPIRYIVETNSADGVIISRSQPDDPRVRYMLDHHMPFVTHGRTDMGIEHCYFDYDNEAFAIEALRILKQRGRKRVALFVPPPALTYYRHTLLGFERGLLQHGLSGFIVGTVDSDSSVSDIRAASLELSRREERPDGIILSSSSSALAVIAGLADGDMAIDTHYDVIAKPLNEQISLAQPGIIGIDEDFRLSGQALAEILVSHINGALPSDLQRIARATVF